MSEWSRFTVYLTFPPGTLPRAGGIRLSVLLTVMKITSGPAMISIGRLTRWNQAHSRSSQRLRMTRTPMKNE